MRERILSIVLLKYGMRSCLNEKQYLGFSNLPNVAITVHIALNTRERERILGIVLLKYGMWSCLKEGHYLEL